MHIVSVGLNHTTAPVALRERLAFDTDTARAALARWGSGTHTPIGHTSSSAPTLEGAILSTCNRLELYAATHSVGQGQANLRQLMAEARGVPETEFAAHLYALEDQGAVQHLFQVTSGLDSMILGEPQILGQVIDAYELALGAGAAGPVMSALMRAAIHCGKRARTETAISHDAASVSSMAARLAEKALKDLNECTVLIVGAGEMAQLAVQAMVHRGACHIIVANRTVERALALAEPLGGQGVTFERLGEALSRADVVISSTGAPHTLIHANQVSQALEQRKGRPIILIDIAVPRDIDPDVADLPGVTLYNIDDLRERVDSALEKRQAQIPHVEAIVAQEVDLFMAYLQTLDVIPTIAELHQRAEVIRQLEVEKTLKRLGAVSGQERDRIEAMSHALVKKLLHAPIMNLRAEAGNGRAAVYTRVVRDLFELYPAANQPLCGDVC